MILPTFDRYVGEYYLTIHNIVHKNDCLNSFICHLYRVCSRFINQSFLFLITSYFPTAGNPDTLIRLIYTIWYQPVICH